MEKLINALNEVHDRRKKDSYNIFVAYDILARNILERNNLTIKEILPNRNKVNSYVCDSIFVVENSCSELHFEILANNSNRENFNTHYMSLKTIIDLETNESLSYSDTLKLSMESSRDLSNYRLEDYYIEFGDLYEVKYKNCLEHLNSQLLSEGLEITKYVNNDKYNYLSTKTVSFRRYNKKYLGIYILNNKKFENNLYFKLDEYIDYASIIKFVKCIEEDTINFLDFNIYSIFSVFENSFITNPPSNPKRKFTLYTNYNYSTLNLYKLVTDLENTEYLSLISGSAGQFSIFGIAYNFDIGIKNCNRFYLTVNILGKNYTEYFTDIYELLNGFKHFNVIYEQIKDDSRGIYY